MILPLSKFPAISKTQDAADKMFLELFRVIIPGFSDATETRRQLRALTFKKLYSLSYLPNDKK